MTTVLVVTGPIAGVIPTPHKAIPSDTLDITPDLIECSSQEQAQAVADAIEDEHRRRGTHPDQEQPAAQPEATVVKLGG